MSEREVLFPGFPARIGRDEAGIYPWEIEGAGRYVGKATRPRGRFNEHSNNVRKIAEGRPYRRSKPDEFRRIHRALAQAHIDGRAMTYSVVETCEAGTVLLERERHWIALLRPTPNGKQVPDQGSRT